MATTEHDEEIHRCHRWERMTRMKNGKGIRDSECSCVHFSGFLVLTGVLLATAVGCERKPAERGEPAAKSKPIAASMPAMVSEMPAEPWVEKPQSQWPQIVLTNQATFKGHTPLRGASSFLIRNAKGRVFAATARHLIGSAGGVEPALSAGELDTALLAWRVYPRTQEQNSLRLGHVAVPGLDAKGRDWLVLTLNTAGPALPSYPLSLRREPVRVGESVYMIGCSYTEPEAVQNVYKGKVTKRYAGGYWRFSINPSVELPGFSGAPILDSRGHVVGVATVVFNDPQMDGDKWKESGGQDVGPVFDAVESSE